MSTDRVLPLPIAALLLALAAASPACTGYPQRLPGPLVLPQEEGEPSGVPPAASGPAAITVQRDSDPVWLRWPGERGYLLLPFYHKRQRVPAGTQVRSGAGGRVEVLWSPDASALVLFDEGRVTTGDPERDEPMLRFHSVTHALLVLTPEDRLELPGGSILTGDPADTTGPILLEMQPGSLLRVTNQSKRLAAIAFRDERLEIGPGESIDLPILALGAGPREGNAPPQLEAPGIPLAIHGEVERAEDPRGVSLRALTSARVLALGVEARLAPQEEARFSGLSATPPAPPADSSGQP